MRDELPEFSKTNESGVVNLDNSRGPGTHWVAYKKLKNNVEYFDSYGDLRPPAELVSYLCQDPRTRIHYNTERHQRPDDWNCGHLSLKFLSSI